MSTQFTNRQWRLPNNENKDKQSNYSMDFDSASSDYISIGNSTDLSFERTNAFTISAWIKTNATSTQVILNKLISNVGYQFFINSAGNLGFYAQQSASVYIQKNSTATFNNNSWHHVVITYDGSSNRSGILLYTNGNLATTTDIGNASLNSTIVNSTNAIIGNSFSGQLDAVSIFNYALSSSQVTTLYGSSSTGIGNPMSLSPKPVAYYPLGDQDAFNGANYLVPNIAAQEDDGDIAVSYSPYALDFDGTNDYIEIPDNNNLDFGTNDFSISAWFKTSVTPSQHQSILSKQNPENSSEWVLQIVSLDNKLGFRTNGVDIVKSTTTVNDGNWNNVIITRVSGVFYLYLNSSQEDTATSSQNLTNSQVLRIGRRYSSYNAYFDGSISNVSIWNTGLTSAQVSELYNEGVPSNLNNHSAYSNLISWWQLGSNSSFNTNWTVLDEKGSNNGTSYNMGEDAIVDGVGSYANGLSSGMGGDEVVGDAPYSTANALSVNMDVEDRVTDTPS